MRNALILLVLVSIGLTTPALAGDRHGEQRQRSDQIRVERVEQDQRNYARHDRRDERYGHFQKRMKKLRRELRHERRENRRLERRDAHRTRQAARYYGQRRHHHAPVVVAPRRPLFPLFFPGITVRIPLNW